jgi:transcriptional regulator
MGIPTTFYSAVQMVGTARVVRDHAEIAALLRRQLARFEDDGGAGLADPAAHGKRLNSILGLIIRVTEVSSKFKFGGNLDAPHRERIAGLLARQGDVG